MTEPPEQHPPVPMQPAQPPAWQQQGYPPQMPQPYMQPMQVAPKSPGLAVIASLFIPGLGSMLSGSGGIGTLILCLYALSWFLSIFLIGFIGVFGFWLWGMFQAHHDAVAWNRRHGIIS